MTDGHPRTPWPNPGSDPLDDRLDRLAADLARADGPADEAGTWPETLWEHLAGAGATRWSMPRSIGGDDCDRATLARRFARIAEGSLTAAFILSQHDASVRRMVLALDAGSPSAGHWLREIAAGRAFTTVGISHLTTSRRYGTQALVAREAPGGGYRLDGRIPWVTAAERAEVIVLGATLEQGHQILVALPTDRPGLTIQPSFPLAALQASCTAEIACEAVPVEAADLIVGPSPDALATPGTAGTGGLETSALALGQARAALVALHAEAPRREDLAEPIEALDDAWNAAWLNLMAAARGEPDATSPTTVRAQANALALRLTQAYLTARKGTGFLRTEPAQRWARQALFFLVWSCPAPVARAAIRDLAGLCSA